jgi:hypothetical protein
MQSQFVIVSIVFASIGAILFAAKAIVVKFSYQYGATADVILTLYAWSFHCPSFWLAVWWSQRHYRITALNPERCCEGMRYWFVGILLICLS